MKRRLLLIIIIVTISLFASNACKKVTPKGTPYMNEAIITGFDMRTCICCGGLMITFSNETSPYIGDFKLIENGADLGITDKDTFPIYVKVDWKIDTTNACRGIIITRIARR